MATILLKALINAQFAFERGERSREELLTAAYEVTSAAQKIQLGLQPQRRVDFEVDYISLADTMTLQELDVVNAAEGAILSGAIKMLPLEATGPEEELGLGGDRTTVRLIDNIKLDLLSSRHYIIPDLDCWRGTLREPARIQRLVNSRIQLNKAATDGPRLSRLVFKRQPRRVQSPPIQRHMSRRDVGNDGSAPGPP